MRESEVVSAPSDLVSSGGRIYHLGLNRREIAPNLLLVGDPARADRVAERFDRVIHRVQHREFVTRTGTFRGFPISVIGTGIGTDNVEIALIEAHAVLSVDLETGHPYPNPTPMTILRVGTSGGLRADIPPGFLGISDLAVGFDGTGLFFDQPPPDDTVLALEAATRLALAAATPSGRRFAGRLPVYASRASAEVVAALRAAADRAAVSAITGTTVAAPGFYGASGRVVSGLELTVPGIKQVLGSLEVEGHPTINVEMESSLLFHLARALGHRVGTICPIISSPGSHGTVVDAHDAIGRAIDIALDALEQLVSTADPA